MSSFLFHFADMKALKERQRQAERDAIREAHRARMEEKAREDEADRLFEMKMSLARLKRLQKRLETCKEEEVARTRERDAELYAASHERLQAIYAENNLARYRRKN